MLLMGDSSLGLLTHAIEQMFATRGLAMKRIPRDLT
jgi:hypothetical protein